MAPAGHETLYLSGQAVEVSHPEKVLYPAAGVTKRDLVAYYDAVAVGLMTAVRDRPLSLERYPGGLGGKSFYLKHLPAGSPIPGVEVTYPSGRTGVQPLAASPAVIGWAVNQNTLVLHPWPVRAADVDRPDELRIDLDPEPSLDFSAVRRAAELTREVLSELGAVGWVKTSGGRGVHILVRIPARWDFFTVRRAGLALGRELERRAPQLISTSWWKSERGQRVFLDYNQNARDRTTAASYSTRADPRASVSAPLHWHELASAEPGDFTVLTMPERFRRIGDPHAGIDDAPFDLTPLGSWVERDERDYGLGEAVWPPHFPKMPGEPSRVDPARARRT